MSLSIENNLSNLLNSYISSKKTSSEQTQVSSTGYGERTAVGRYINSDGEKDAKTLFQKLSIDVGSDGKKITKDQLDSYIEKNKNVPEQEMNVLKEIQTNWDKISDKADTVRFGDLVSSGADETLLSMVPEKESKIDYKQIAADATAQAYGKIVSSAFEGISKKASSNDFSSMLNTLLTGSKSTEEDDANAEMIAKLTNLIEKYKNVTTTTEYEV